MKYDCTECAKCGTKRCLNPGECVKGGYKYFENPHNDRSKFCELCGERLFVAYIKKPSPECWGKALKSLYYVVFVGAPCRDICV